MAGRGSTSIRGGGIPGCRASSRAWIVSAPLAAIAALIALGPAGPAAHGAGGCDRVAAPTGSDSAKGSREDPFRTAQRLVDSLAPNQTGCLRAGTYASVTPVKLWTPGITLTSYPGERATVRGRVRVEASATGAALEGLILDGRNPENQLSPLIYASRAVVRDNEITNYNTAICVHVANYPGTPIPHDVLIAGNRIHHCGKLPATNHQHGIYVAKARDAVIRGNWIYANADRGVQLYPDADRTIVTGNVVDSNGQGVIFGGGASSSSDDNLVTRNLISNSTIRHNISSNWQGPTGSGNLARDNCVIGGRDPQRGGIEHPTDGFVAHNNRIPDPKIVAAALARSRPGARSICPRRGPALVRGTHGPDRLMGTAGRDRLTGRAGRDRLIGRAGRDRLHGGGGGDRIVAGAGSDAVAAGGGGDRVRARDGERDRIRCGHGRDTAKVDRHDRVRGCERVRR